MPTVNLFSLRKKSRIKGVSKTFNEIGSRRIELKWFWLVGTLTHK